MLGVCGHEITKERYDAGYLYCVRRECFRQFGRKQVIHAVHVNKSIPAIVRVDTKEQ